MSRAPLILFLACVLLAAAPDAAVAKHYIMLGCNVTASDHPPLVSIDGQDYLDLGLLTRLGLEAPPPTLGQDSLTLEHYDPDEGAEEPVIGIDTRDGSTDVRLIAPPSDAPLAIHPGLDRYRLARNVLDVAPHGEPQAIEINGKALDSASLRDHGGQRYIAASVLSSLGLFLSFNTTQRLYQLTGLVHRVEYRREDNSMILRSLTPLAIEGVQSEDNLVTFVAEGGFFAPTESHDIPGGSAVTRLGFKSQPELGRCFVFARQAQRTGFKVDTEQTFGYSRIRFGNYFRAASPYVTSSGEVALNITLGAPTSARHELIPDPWRVVVDFPGATYEDATQTIGVNSGVVEQVRVGSPSPGTVRVVLDLKERADYRILKKDNGSKYYLQVLPYVSAGRTAAELRRGRVIMIDPGHGGSDPGAQGVLPGVWEAVRNLEISELLIRELRNLGYEVVSTRSHDRFVSLGMRADYANQLLPYVFVSVHCNSFPTAEMQGAMTFNFPGSTYGPVLARHIQAELTSMTGAVDRGVREANFFVLRETVVPSVLVECGFLTNKEECRRLSDPAYQLLVARAIASGIDRYISSGY